MCNILLLAISIASSYCGIPDVRIETKSFTSNREDGSRTKRATLAMLKEMTAELRNCDTIISEPVFKIASGRATGGTLLQSRIIRKKRQEKEISIEREGDIIGARTKRQVLKKDSDANSTWKDGVFYMFDTSGWLLGNRLIRCWKS
uniref:Secreted protein n=1 Tax=Angiostrongylus cantonensis TaxID=6313 RepID=A0A0K0D280_ANGCA